MQKHEWVVGCCSENFGCGEAARTVLLARCFNVQARQRSLRYSRITELRWEGGTRPGGQLRRNAGRPQQPPVVCGPSAPARPGRKKSTPRTSPLEDIGALRPAPPGQTKSTPHAPLPGRNLRWRPAPEPPNPRQPWPA